MQAIFTYIFLNETSETFDKCMNFIERLTEIKLSELIIHSQKLIINQLLFNYHRAPGKVLNGLKKAISLSSESGKQEIVSRIIILDAFYCKFTIINMSKKFRWKV